MPKACGFDLMASMSSNITGRSVGIVSCSTLRMSASHEFFLKTFFSVQTGMLASSCAADVAYFECWITCYFLPSSTVRAPAAARRNAMQF